VKVEDKAQMENSERRNKTMKKEMSERKNGEEKSSSEPCKPTTSICARSTHFVRRKKEQIRSAVVPIRLTTDERDSLQITAQSRGLSLSAFVRTIVLGLKLPTATPPEINRRTYLELARIGNNLNQLARAVNSGLVKFLECDTFDKLSEQVRRIGLMLLRTQ